MDKLKDTITAIATAYGEGSIGIIRISGESTLHIIDQLFTTPKGNKLSDIESHRLYYGYITDPRRGEKIDEVMLVVTKKPKSYTWEDVAEISCHGGMEVLKIILHLILHCGARLAEPGEFTRRAFLNGRIDLLQAEGVIDIIRARNEDALRVAVGQIQGTLSEEIREIRDLLIGSMSRIEACLDFADEGIDRDPDGAILKGIEGPLSRIIHLIESYDKGKKIRDGISIVIVGKPNVGKSSLMNSLLKRDRAIVTPTPGTTRDVLGEEIEFSGILFRLNDTAGIREESQDMVEREGVRRTKEEMEKADIILLVLDGSQGKDIEDERVISLARKKDTIAIINKIDLLQKLDDADIIPFFSRERTLKVSAKKGYGLDDLKEHIEGLVRSRRITPWESTLLTKLRQKEELANARDKLMAVKGNIEAGLPEEIWSLDMREAIDSLNELLGETYNDDVLDKIFSTFCIGK